MKLLYYLTIPSFWKWNREGGGGQYNYVFNHLKDRSKVIQSRTLVSFYKREGGDLYYITQTDALETWPGKKNHFFRGKKLDSYGGRKQKPAFHFFEAVDLIYGNGINKSFCFSTWVQLFLNPDCRKNSAFPWLWDLQKGSNHGVKCFRFSYETNTAEIVDSFFLTKFSFSLFYVGSQISTLNCSVNLQKSITWNGWQFVLFYFYMHVKNSVIPRGCFLNIISRINIFHGPLAHVMCWILNLWWTWDTIL